MQQCCIRNRPWALASLRRGKRENRDLACLEWAGSLGFQNVTSESSPDLLSVSVILSLT